MSTADKLSSYADKNNPEDDLKKIFKEAQEEREKDEYNERLYDLSKTAMGAIISGKYACPDHCNLSEEYIAKEAVEYATALLDELKKVNNLNK